MASGDVVEATNGFDGLVLVGEYLGVQEARKYTRKDGKDGLEPAKVGIKTRGGVYEVSVGDDDALSAFRRDNALVKGDRVSIEVDALPPWGARGDVRVVRRGLLTREWL